MLSPACRLALNPAPATTDSADDAADDDEDNNHDIDIGDAEADHCDLTSQLYTHNVAIKHPEF